jgi:hypothetical protein
LQVDQSSPLSVAAAKIRARTAILSPPDARRGARSPGFGGKYDVVDEVLAAAANLVRLEGDDDVQFRHDIDRLAPGAGGKKRRKIGLGAVDPPEITISGVDGRPAVGLLDRGLRNESLRNDLLVPPAAALEIKRADPRHVARRQLQMGFSEKMSFRVGEPVIIVDM